ncbi:hypothetical protein [Granulicella sp. dw_53]|uniref:hypothetical protein n=1 Tax=Granulicella sp. dw_53 TaxID=2719792 RepID=UPI001BD2FFA0|nr:hypothetical protein [Granulicella sp. dw_53]
MNLLSRIPRAVLAVLLLVVLLLVGGRSGLAQQNSTEGPLMEVAPKTLSNDSIVRMVKAGLGDELIVQTIQAQPGRYNTDADALVVLKEAGVSDRLITAMMNKSRRQITAAHEALAPVTPEVNEIGVYYKDRNGNWVPVEPEIVHIKSGGWVKSTVTHGIIKQDRNGHINGRESKLVLQRPIQILIYVPEGISATEYDLVKFRLNSNSREFRTLTGGVFHSTGGADRDEVKFTPEKTAPRTYQFTMDQKVDGGEYGILPPGTGNVTNGGKIYTFAIVE